MAVIALPSNIYRYVWEASGWHQLPLVVLTVCVSLLEVVPLELQRRIVDDAVKNRNYWSVLVLCAVYLGTVLFQGGAKLVLNVYRSWVGERATRDLRRRVRVLVSSPSPASSGSEAQGVQAKLPLANAVHQLDARKGGCRVPETFEEIGRASCRERV